MRVTFCSWWVEDCIYVGWHLLLFGFVLSHKNVNIELEKKKKNHSGFSHTVHKVNDQFCVSGEGADQIPAATAVISALYWVFVEVKQIEEIRWHANLRHSKPPFFLCYWAPKQGTMGLVVNKCSHVHRQKHRQRVQSEAHTVSRCNKREVKWSLRLVTKTHTHTHTCRELGQILWYICRSSIFISSDVKSITLKKERQRNKEKEERQR